MANRQGGFISGTATTISTAANFAGGNQSATDLKTFAESAVISGVASGMFDLDEYYNNVKDGTWPNATPANVAPTARRNSYNKFSIYKEVMILHQTW